MTVAPERAPAVDEVARAWDAVWAALAGDIGRALSILGSIRDPSTVEAALAEIVRRARLTPEQMLLIYDYARRRGARRVAEYIASTLVRRLVEEARRGRLDGHLLRELLKRGILEKREADAIVVEAALASRDPSLLERFGVDTGGIPPAEYLAYIAALRAAGVDSVDALIERCLRDPGLAARVYRAALQYSRDAAEKIAQRLVYEAVSRGDARLVERLLAVFPHLRGFAARVAASIIARAAIEGRLGEAERLAERLAPIIRGTEYAKAIVDSLLVRRLAALTGSKPEDVARGKLDLTRVDLGQLVGAVEQVARLAEALGVDHGYVNEYKKRLLALAVAQRAERGTLRVADVSLALSEGAIDRRIAEELAAYTALVEAGGDPEKADEILARHGFGRVWTRVVEELRRVVGEEAVKRLLEEAKRNPSLAVALAGGVVARVYRLSKELSAALSRLTSAKSIDEARAAARQALTIIDQLLSTGVLKPEVTRDLQRLRLVLEAVATGTCRFDERVCSAIRRLGEAWDENAVRVLGEYAARLGGTAARVLEVLALLAARRGITGRLDARTAKTLAERLRVVAEAFGDRALARQADALAIAAEMIDAVQRLSGIFTEAVNRALNGDYEGYEKLLSQAESLVKKLMSLNDTAVQRGLRLPLDPAALGRMMSLAGAMLEALAALRSAARLAERLRRAYEEARRVGDDVRALHILADISRVAARIYSVLAERAMHLGLDERELRRRVEILNRAARQYDMLAVALSALKELQSAIRVAAENWNRETAARLVAAARAAYRHYEELRRVKEWVVDRELVNSILGEYRRMFESRDSPLAMLAAVHPSLIDRLREAGLERVASLAEELRGRLPPVAEQVVEAVERVVDDMIAYWNSVWQRKLAELRSKPDPFRLLDAIIAAVGNTGAYLLDALTQPLQKRFYMALSEIASRLPSQLAEALSSPQKFIEALTGLARALVEPFTPEALERSPGLAASMVALGVLTAGLEGIAPRLARFIDALSGDPVSALSLVIDLSKARPGVRVLQLVREGGRLGVRVEEDLVERLARLYEEAGFDRSLAERMARIVAESVGRAVAELGGREAERLAARVLAERLRLAAAGFAKVLAARGFEKPGFREAVLEALRSLAERLGRERLARAFAALEESYESLAREYARLAEELERAAPVRIRRELLEESRRLAREAVETVERIERLVEELPEELREEVERAAFERFRELQERAARLAEEARRSDIGGILARLSARVERLAEELRRQGPDWLARTGLREILDVAGFAERLAERVSGIDEEAARLLRTAARKLRSRSLADILEGIEAYSRALERLGVALGERRRILSAILPRLARLEEEGVEEAGRLAKTLRERGVEEALETLRGTLIGLVEEAREEYMRGSALAAVRTARLLSELEEAAREIGGETGRRMLEAIEAARRRLKPILDRIAWVPTAEAAKLAEALEETALALRKAGLTPPEYIEAAVEELRAGVVGSATLKALEAIARTSPLTIYRMSDLLEALAGRAPGPVRATLRRVLEAAKGYARRLFEALKSLGAAVKSPREAVSRLRDILARVRDAVREAARLGIFDPNIVRGVKRLLEVLRADRYASAAYRDVIDELARILPRVEEGALAPVTGGVMEAIAEARPLLTAPREVLERVERLLEEPRLVLRRGPFVVERLVSFEPGGRARVKLVLRIDPRELAERLAARGVPREEAERLARMVYEATGGRLYEMELLADYSMCRKPGPCPVRIVPVTVTSNVEKVAELLDRIVRECRLTVRM